MEEAVQKFEAAIHLGENTHLENMNELEQSEGNFSLVGIIFLMIKNV